MAETLILAGKENIGFSIFEEAKENCQDERERSQIEIWKAEMLLMAGKTKETIEILKKYSRHLFSKCWEGAALSMEGEFKKAEKKLKDAEKANPKDYEAVFWLIETLIKANKKKRSGKKTKKDRDIAVYISVRKKFLAGFGFEIFNRRKKRKY